MALLGDYKAALPHALRDLELVQVLDGKRSRSHAVRLTGLSMLFRTETLPIGP